MALTDQLEAWWNLNELSGSRVDSSGNNRSLAETAGGVADAIGKIGNAVSFVGGSGYLSRSAVVTSGTFSFSGWFRVNDEGGNDVVLWLQSGGGSGRQSLSWSSDGTSITGASRNSGLTVNAEVSHDVWFYAVLTNDGTTQRLYVNGSLIDSNASVPDYTGLTTFQIGAGDSLVGQIDLFGIWSRALSFSEVVQLYNLGDGLDPTAGSLPMLTASVGWVASDDGLQLAWSAPHRIKVGETVRVFMDFVAIAEVVGGDTVLSQSIAADPPVLTLANPAVVGTQLQVDVTPTAGSEGTNCRLNFTAALSSSAVKVRTGMIRIPPG